jgi:hypothetical protein
VDAAGCSKTYVKQFPNVFMLACMKTCVSAGQVKSVRNYSHAPTTSCLVRFQSYFSFGFQTQTGTVHWSMTLQVRAAFCCFMTWQYPCLDTALVTQFSAVRGVEISVLCIVLLLSASC